ncbi:phage tail protein [Zooshikella ganghwensis]|uniref:Phage tail fibre protein N-terminal domain-containing protein n=1 Tax=Zooshikella ganghwensis TaxID=202772 RepID=A0A4P9VH65_9GAMM|nr:phage tail protein [Zooshikella ganghwensis]RDH41660.1 hypothetical protein B9G39_27310 [Zooshikella ganghwensis]RDH41682.1 hypothetical protein B9G39_26855 [Zooshikella ganghwensis]RDH41739.1 hypothetical protein B9G39_27150 [Zooshikella ganghwensis]
MSDPILQFTQTGLAELISAKNAGIKATITHMACGDKSYSPQPNQTRLVNERQRADILDYEELSPTQLRLGAVFKGDLEYEVREIGLFLSSGTLLAVHSQPNQLLTYKSANSSWLQKLTLDISPLPTNSINVVVGTENINLLLANELATMAAATIDNMHRHIELLFRVNQLKKQKV